MNGLEFWVLITGGTIFLLLSTAYDRWISPRLARREVRRLLKSAQSAKPVRHPTPDHGITFDFKGFTIRRLKGLSGQGVSLAWQDVQRITAFKRDLFTVDCVCLSFAGRDASRIELNEEMAGWEEFTRALPTYLPGCRPWSEWFCEVAFPAFATNLTEIFSRDVPEPA